MESIERRPFDQLTEVQQSHELVGSNGRPVRVYGSEVGEVVTREGVFIRVYRTRSGRRVLHRMIDSCCGGHSDVLVVESLDDDRLTELLGFGPDAMGIYERLGVDPVRVLE